MESSIVIAALSALAQESRLAIFRMLVAEGQPGLAAGEIAQRLQIPAATLSFHLSQLRHAGLIESRREERSIIYSANFSSMMNLIAYLTENCCGGMGSCATSCDPTPKPKRRKS